MKETRNRTKTGFNPIVFIKALVGSKLSRQLTSLIMSIVIFMVTIFGNTTVAFAGKKDDVINRIIDQYQNGEISRDEAKRALIRNGVTNSPIIDLDEDEDGNKIATESDLAKKLGEKDRLIDEKIRKIIEDNRDTDTGAVFAWHHENVDTVVEKLSDIASQSNLEKTETETDDSQNSSKSTDINDDESSKTTQADETDSVIEFEKIEAEEDAAEDKADEEEIVFEDEIVSEDEESDENQVSENIFEDDSEDEENEDSDSVKDDEVLKNNSEEEEDSSLVETAEANENDSEDQENEDSDSAVADEVLKNSSEDQETEVFDSAEDNEVFDNNSEDEEEDEDSNIVETASANENDSEDNNFDSIKIDEFFEIDSYVEDEDSDSVETAEVYEDDSENSEDEDHDSSDETNETAETKALGISAHSDKTAIAQTEEDTEVEAENTEAKALGISAHSDKTAIAQTEEGTEASSDESVEDSVDESFEDSADEEDDDDVIDLSEYMTISSAVKKFHEDWIESESFDSGNKIGLTLYFSIPEDVMYDKDTRVAAYSMPEGLTSQFEGKGKVISGDETVGTYKLKKNEIEITFDTAFVKSGKSIEGALFFKGRVENNTDEDCLTIELGGTAGSLNVYKEITKTVISDDGKVRVTATFGASTFDGNVTLHADSLDEETKLDIENAYNEKISEEERHVSDLYLYDVYFLDEEDDKIEPDGHVSVKITFIKPVESEDDEEVKVIHVKNNDISDIEDLTSMDDTVINENSKGEIKNVELVTDSFSTYGVILTEITGPEEDIKEFLSSLSITGAEQSSDGNTWTVKNKTLYSLYLSFSEVSGGVQFPNDTTWMYYEIPAGLYIEDKETTFDVIIDHTYTISGNKVIVDSQKRRLYFQWNTKHENFKHLQSATDVKITAEISGKLNNEEVNFEFPNGVIKTIKINKEHDVSINKWAYYDKNDGMIHYTVNVYSNGVSENVVVTDTINGSLISLDTSSDIKITSNKGSIKATVENKNSKGFTVKVPEMKDGESVNIEYLAKIDSVPDGAKATLDTTGNTGNVTADDDKDPSNNKKEYIFNISTLKKYTNGVGGVLKDSDGNLYGEITYTIEANEERIANLSYITDTIDANSRQYLSYTGTGLNIYINGSDTVNMTVKWDDLELVKDSDGKVYGWTWRIPTDSNFVKKYGKNASFKIKYKTKVDRSSKDILSIKNSVKTNHHDSVTSETGVNPYTYYKEFTKKAKSYTSEKITWELTVEVPANGYNYLRINDYLPYKYEYYDDLFGTTQDITITGLTDKEKCVVSKQLIGHSDNQHGYLLSFIFYKDETKNISTDKNNDNTGLTGTGSTRTITITYSSKNNTDWVTRASGNDYETYKGHYNTAKFLFNDDYVWRGDTVIIVNSNIRKTGSIYCDNNGTVPYVTDDGYYIFAYDIAFNGLNGTYPDGLIFEDTYDERLSFVDTEVPYRTTDNGTIYTGSVWYQGDDRGKADISVDNANHKLTISIPKVPVDGSGKYYDAYRIRYYLKVKKDTAIALALQNKNDSKGSVTFNNKVKWGSFETEADVIYEYQILDKDGSYNKETGLADYEIVINPNKDTLNDEKVMKLLDEFENQIIDISTIEITEEDLNGVVKKADNIKYSIEGNKLTFTNIPDKTKVVITYNALPQLTSNKVTLTNKATLLWSSDETKFDAEFYLAAQGSGTTASIKLVKHKAGEDSKKLAGAVFDLYKVDNSGSAIKDSTGKTQCKGIPMTYTDEDGETKIIQFTTDDQGIAEISLNDIDTEEAFAYGQKYCLVESQAPEGYQVDKNNVYYFAFANPEATTFSYDSENPLYPKGYVLSISNEEIKFALPDTGSIGVNVMYLAGTIMVALGGIFLVLRKRKENQL
ncbi:LPXTG-motif cell wall anchor domain-containing protein [Oribacterium sp. KHPX15]|uniref:LPXTG cell wall anchor domain-containing protein n=1 Tax=Oribacterium sp. KHPX15 TaxID=1855342 RepID=UPI0008997105|nr:SpaA isopeptide-forming pilin-related protein [Oribacterium sp. KHPX15]SEA22782.1 LPXTG-motif cell wall anchor domain-containing protein [Oribacterium sp. KHPX15]